jgi:ribosomal RNA-processing protein 36
VTGQLDTHKFRQQYNFLFTARETELATLRENLKRARKLLENSPRALRDEREAEVSRLELAVKRSESLVQRDRREKVEAEALSAVKQEENQKRKTGKGQWWMKNCEFVLCLSEGLF